jgi:hypothetical protein
MRNAYKIFVGRLEGKKPLGRCMHRCDKNIKMWLKEIGSEVVDWIHLPQDLHVASSREYRNESTGSIKYWELLE